MIPLLWINIINQLGSAVGLLLLWWYFLHWVISNYQEHSFNLRMIKRLSMARTCRDDVFVKSRADFEEGQVIETDGSEVEAPPRVRRPSAKKSRKGPNQGNRPAGRSADYRQESPRTKGGRTRGGKVEMTPRGAGARKGTEPAESARSGFASNRALMSRRGVQMEGGALQVRNRRSFASSVVSSRVIMLQGLLEDEVAKHRRIRIGDTAQMALFFRVRLAAYLRGLFCSCIGCVNCCVFAVSCCFARKK